MLNEGLVQKWLDEGTIDQHQAEKMRTDLAEYAMERRSRKRTTAFSIIGALLIGIGAILFVASNWQRMGEVFRVLLLVGSTLGVHYAGYRLRYGKEDEKYIRIGRALILLSALLFGASLFLIAQIYNINANESTLVLIWILAVLPLIYGYQSAPIAGLCAVLFFLWIVLLHGERMDLNKFIEIWDLCLISGIGLYLIGLLHDLSERTMHASMAFKFIGLQASLLILFIFTFGHHRFKVDPMVPAAFAILCVLLFAAVLSSRSIRTGISGLREDLSMLYMPAIAFLMAVINLTGIYSPLSDKAYTAIFNIIFLALLILLLYAGYEREDFRAIYTALFWLMLLIFARYFDFFWEMLPRSIFFAVGGLILLVMSVIMDRKRRELKIQFARTGGRN